jgi:hypothetical protein
MLGMLNALSSSGNGGGDMLKILEGMDKSGAMKNMSGIFNMLPAIMNLNNRGQPQNTSQYKSNNEFQDRPKATPRNQSDNDASQNQSKNSPQSNRQNSQNPRYNQSQNTSQSGQENSQNQSNDSPQTRQNNSQNPSRRTPPNLDKKQGAVMKNNEYENHNSANGDPVLPLRRNGYTNQADQNRRRQDNASNNQYNSQNKQDQYADRNSARQAQYGDPFSHDEKTANNDAPSASYADLQYINTAPKYKSTRKRNNIRYTGK